ncbi:hypothetical protein F4802DRAFT_553245 [Xylaria palmicola]|nr:hypothetical protein F4802DRAFT_553245 [Xylaria palmicola]
MVLAAGPSTMASPFGVLKPLHRYNRQQQHQAPPPQQQQNYNHHVTFRLSLPPPSSQQQQQQQQQQQRRTATGTNNATTTTTPTATSANANTYPQIPSQPQSPALHGTVAGPPRPQQLQTTSPIPVPVPIAAMNSRLTDTHMTSAVIAPIPPPDMSAVADPQRRRRAPGRPAKRRRSDDDDDNHVTEQSLRSPIPPRPPTVHPFSKGPYNTIEDAIFSLQLHVFTSGYGVSQKRTVKEKLPSGKYDPEGDVIRKDFACDKGGNEFVSQSRGQRRRESKKCGCPWKAAIRRLRREGDRWFVEILDAQHNHPATPPDEMHAMASYRRWQRENNAGIRGAIARLTRAAALPPRDIAAYLKGGVRDRDLDRIDKQILRALSMGDKEAPGSEREGGAVAFDMIARRPVIILQDNEAPSSTPLHGHGSSPPVSGFRNPATPTTAFDESPVAHHHAFTGTFASPQPPLVGGSGATAIIHQEYSVVS